MSKTDLIDNGRKIYHLIVKHPGLNLTELSKISHLSIPLVDYHTLYLKRYGLIDVDKQDGYKRYYPKDKIGLKEKKFLSFLRREIPLKIVLFLLENPYSKHKEILENFDISPSTLTYHLNNLVKSEIIIFKKEEGEHGSYSIRDEEGIISFLIRYKPHAVIKRFKDTWDGFHIP